MSFVVNGTVAALVAIIMQMLIKPLLEVWIKPTAPSHDNLVRAVALLLAVALLAVDTLVGGPWPATGDAWLLLVGGGMLSGLTAIGGYHAITGSASPTVLQSAFTSTLEAGPAHVGETIPGAVVTTNTGGAPVITPTVFTQPAVRIPVAAEVSLAEALTLPPKVADSAPTPPPAS